MFPDFDVLRSQSLRKQKYGTSTGPTTPIRRRAQKKGSYNFDYAEVEVSK